MISFGAIVETLDFLLFDTSCQSPVDTILALYVDYGTSVATVQFCYCYSYCSSSGDSPVLGLDPQLLSAVLSARSTVLLRFLAKA